MTQNTQIKKRTYAEGVYSSVARKNNRFKKAVVSNVKFDEQKVNTVVSNIEKILISQGYSENEAKKQAEVLAYKLFQMNYIYHPAEKISSD